MMNNIDIIRNANMICMPYCMKAIMSPTCMFASATCLAPNQMTPTMTRFMTNIMTGIITTIRRLMNRETAVRSTLALSKRFSSNFCMLKARMTIMPERFSRATRLTRSVNFWMILNLGMAIATTTMIKLINIITPTTISQASGESLESTFRTPPMPIMGA